MKSIIAFVLIFVSLFSFDSARAEDFNFKVKNYKEASQQGTFLKFEMESTKMGLVTTGFTGYVKEFMLSANVSSDKFTDAKIKFEIKSMDTDIDGRNEKMWETCFAYDKHPTIIVEVSGDVVHSPVWKEYPATIDVRGKKHNINVKIKSAQVEGIYKIDLESTVSLKALEIPDPSIIIATVRDTILLRGHFDIPGK
jgi:hypothetical protein